MFPSNSRILQVAIVLWTVNIVWPVASMAQLIPPIGFPFSSPPGVVPPAPSAVAPPSAMPERAIAATGRPYGVAIIEVPLTNPVVGGGPMAGGNSVIVGGPSPLVVSADDPAAGSRILFPIATDVVAVGRPPSQQPLPPIGGGRLLNRVGNLIREITSSDGAGQQIIGRRVMFLIRDDAPLFVTVRDGNRVVGQYNLTPTSNPTLQSQLLSQWWADMTTVAGARIAAAQSPPIVDTYLVSMLSRQLNLPLPDRYGEGFVSDDSQSDPLKMTLKWVSGAKDVSNDVFAAAAIGLEPGTIGGSPVGADIAALELPDGPNWQTTSIADEGLDVVEIEPLASRVPPECFYLRYGKFENYLWFKDLTDEYGGDISRMITLSSLEGVGSARFERQLGVAINAMSRMLGPSVIIDQAVIGSDLMLDSGASMGVLMQSANAFLLRTSLNNDRQTLAATDPSIKLKTIQLPGGEASLMRTPDNRIRSFLVERDGFFLLTNSQTLAERFLEVSDSGQSLATTNAFRNARRLVPLSRDDTVFAYLSPEMLQRLLSPASMIELRRRMQAEADMSLVRLARLAAASVGTPIDSIDELIATGYLPPNFGERADGSGVIAYDDKLVDTLRGARGTFLPIADVKIQSVTQNEARWVEEIVTGFQHKFSFLDPIVIGVHRDPVDAPEIDDPEMSELRERLTIHAEIAPWQASQYGWWAQQLGPPTDVAMRFAPDDIVSVQAHVVSDALGSPTHLFAAIKDTNPPAMQDFDGLIGGYRAIRQLPGYLGAWPQPGALDRLPLGLGRGQPVGPGMTRLIGGIYRYTGGGFSVLSMQPEILQTSLPHLAAVDAKDTAQFRGHIGNLLDSQLEGWVNGQLYERASIASSAGAELLNSIHTQFRIPADQTPKVAASILGASIQDPLGGEYQYDSAKGVWASPVATNTLTPPPGYRAPILTWFRSGDAKVTQFPNRLSADVELVIARQKR